MHFTGWKERRKKGESTMEEYACKLCKRIIKSKVCPVCKTTEVSKSWKGIIVIFDENSEIAKAAGITAPGKYAIRVK